MNNQYKLPEEIIFWGGTGQAIVDRFIVEYYGSKLIAVFDDTEVLKSPFNDIPLYRGRDFLKWLDNKNPENIGFVIAIGNPHGRVRLELAKKLKTIGLIPCSLIHPETWIDPNVKFGEGAQIMAGVIIQAKTRIGKQCIINTKASIDHECCLNDGSEIAPGATICGNVRIGTNVWIGAGTTILPRIVIGDDSIVGAGSLVAKDVPNNILVYGIPAKEIRKI